MYKNILIHEPRYKNPHFQQHITSPFVTLIHKDTDGKMNGRAILNCVLIILFIIATFEITEACKKCGQDVCGCNSHGGHHIGLTVGNHHPHSGLCHSGRYGYSCSHQSGHHPGGIHPGFHNCGGVHIGGGYGLHVGHIGGGYGLGGGNYILGGYGSVPSICSICGGYAYNGGFLRRRHWKPRCRCY
ncbi:PREDICTED: glycine-rich cell wall structural protein-like [Ceratosolen solmsi marchali]|uniref:Glycine-rich cell wall structural protein-like n=1 Tax=Ceratosolen solmsi marchali TaxID=326594 RepID=A0AAJ6YRI7_9HYME|nr:PREDICTED: glycine-rich cell wall structural protein-like [Ceratosolen solmsi marchali]